MLPAAVEVAAYRVAQEALTNVVRHAGAGRLRLGLQVAAVAAARWRSSTTGAGSTRARGAVSGMSSCRERAREIGGSVDVGGAIRGGTTVTLTLPLREGRVP